MENSVVSIQIMAKIYRSWLNECDYHSIQQFYFTKTSENCFYIVNLYPCTFSMPSKTDDPILPSVCLGMLVRNPSV